MQCKCCLQLSTIQPNLPTCILIADAPGVHVVSSLQLLWFQQRESICIHERWGMNIHYYVQYVFLWLVLHNHILFENILFFCISTYPIEFMTAEKNSVATQWIILYVMYGYMPYTFLLLFPHPFSDIWILSILLIVCFTQQDSNLQILNPPWIIILLRSQNQKHWIWFHPSIRCQPTILCTGLWRGSSQFQLATSKRQGTPWTGLRSIAGHIDTNNHSHLHLRVF